MNVSGPVGGSLALDVVATMTGLKQQETAGKLGMALLRKAFDTQEVLAAQLLQAMGIGQQVDVAV